MIPRHALPLSLMAASILALSGQAQAAAIIAGSGANDNLGNAQNWGTSDPTTSPIIVDLRFDFNTTAAANTNFMWLWEFGAGVGSSLTISDTHLYLTSDGGSNGGSHFVTGAHGLSGGTASVQVVSVLDVANDILSIYVNGGLVAENTSYGAGDWAGTDSSVLAPLTGGGGDEPAGTIAYPNAASSNFSMSVYLLGDGTGNTHTLNSILIPEPSAALLGALGTLLLLRRRRH